MTTSRRLSPPRQSHTIKSATSTPNIRKMAAVAPAAPLIRSPTHFRLGSESLSTLRDPRSENDLRAAAARDTSPHPDLNLEVAALSNKLISAINYQTTLDDALASTREELRQTQERLKQAESRNQEHEKQLQDGSWVRREEVDERTSELFRKFSVEKRARELADREKRAIESELADLSTKLFEEANQARKETEAAENRTEQVRAQLAETESLLASQQEQLVELKLIMAQDVRHEDHEATNASTAPSTPAVAQGGFDSIRGLDTPQSATIDRPDPAPPLHFSHLVAPILRNDVPALDDFRALLEINRKIASSTPASRVTSGTYSSLTNSGAAQLSNSPQITTGPSNSSSTNLAASTASQTHSPSTSTNSTASGTGLYSPTFYPPLRETKFFKRALSEDIDPTLRLDVAPGLSFFARRSVTSAIHDSTLLLEPVPSSSRKLITSCTLCGERRRGDQHARTHRFKTGEESAQWYPLCAFCVSRIRSTCDYIGFLRMVRDGFWRCEGEKGEEKAWEESVRLRERMFWARIGGGVVPSITLGPKEEGGFESKFGSKRPSVDVGKRRSKEVGPNSATAATDDSRSEVLTPPQTAREFPASPRDLQSRPPSEEEEEMPEIRELPSTEPPLRTTSATTSPTNATHPKSAGSISESSVAGAQIESPIAEPLRQTLASSLRRISLRESFGFGSRSRNASRDRAGGPAAPSVESPRLGAVAEMRAVYEGREGEPGENKEEKASVTDNKGTEEAVNGEETTKTEGEQTKTGGQLKEAAEIKEVSEKTEEQERPQSLGLNINLPGGFD